VPAVQARPGALSATGEYMLGAGLEAMGRGLRQLGVSLDVLDKHVAQAELSTMQRQRDERMIEAFARIAEEPDYTQHDRIFQESLKEVTHYEFKNRRAADAYQQDLNRLIPYWQSKLLSLSTSRKIKTIDADTRVNIERGLEGMQEAIRDAREDDALLAKDRALEAIARREELGLYSPAQAEAARETLALAEQRTQTWAAATAADDMKKGLAVIRQSKLPASERDALERQYRTEWNRRQADLRDAQEQAAEQERLEILDALVQGQLTWEQIAKTEFLPASERYTWWTRLEAQGAARARGEAGPLETTDPSVQWDFLRRIYTGEPVSEGEIIQAVGNGLSIQTAEDLIGKVRKRAAGPDVLDRLEVQAVLKQMADLRRGHYFHTAATGTMYEEIKGEPAKWQEALRENDRYYNLAVERFTQWVQDHPDAPPSDVYQVADEILYPAQRAAALGTLGTVWRWYIWPTEEPKEAYTRRAWEEAAKGVPAREFLETLTGRERELWEKYKAEGMSPEEFLEVLRKVKGLPE